MTDSEHRPQADSARKGHTPGPWSVERYGDGDSLVIHSDHVSRVCFMATPGSHGDPAMIEADARLIAAAPDLLDALQETLEIYVRLAGSGDCGFWNPEEEQHVINARAAIAKATGSTA